jgi:hypothetical protein
LYSSIFRTELGDERILAQILAAAVAGMVDYLKKMGGWEPLHSWALCLVGRGKGGTALSSCLTQWGSLFWSGMEVGGLGAPRKEKGAELAPIIFFVAGK